MRLFILLTTLNTLKDDDGNDDDDGDRLGLFQEGVNYTSIICVYGTFIYTCMYSFVGIEK